MQLKALILNTILIVFFLIAFIITGCKKEEEIALPEGVTKVDTTHIDQPEKEAIEKKGAQLKEGLKALMAAFEKKEQELNQREAEIIEKEDELAEIEKLLKEREKSLTTYRNITYFILIISLAFFLVGLILILWTRKKEALTKENKKAARQEKKLVKNAEKKQSEVKKSKTG